MTKNLFLFILTIFLILGFTTFKSIGQDNPLYKLEERLMKGDKAALFKIAGYFDSDKQVIERLGYHRVEVKESEIAKRIVDENCLFLETELQITDSTSAKQFLDFLNINKKQISFSTEATAFLITPLAKRDVNFEIRELSKERVKQLRDNYEKMLSPEWVKESKVPSLIKQKNPQVLLTIASELFKERSRWNRYCFHEEEYTDLLQLLTGIEIGVENEQKEISWHVDKDFNIESKLNLLIYFSKYFKNYSWDDKKTVFTNPDNVILPIEKERVFFQLLGSKNDSIAMDAFIQLTSCFSGNVIRLSYEYEGARIEKNGAIPIFPYKFLKQLVLLTEYCRTNEIDYVGSKELQADINALKSQLTFSERRRIEDKLISSLTLNEIAAFEYWALINEQSWMFTYSAGRILDVFYSRNWNKLLADKKQFDCYLKKSKLFSNLGIIGTCNNYLKKFSNSSQLILEQLQNYPSSDNDIKEQAAKAVQLNLAKATEKEGTISWEGNQDYEVKNLKEQLLQLTNDSENSSKNADTIAEILSQINYEQIPIALNLIEKYPFESSWMKYSFMERDWGFFMAGDFDKKETRDEFLKLYAENSEYQLYAYYLNLAGIEYQNTDNTLDYDKIYELLKYDVVVAFSGGGGGSRDNEVYSLVKLLEITFNTTLGFPKKLCNSDNVWGCDSDERAKTWMNYFKEKKLLKYSHDEPVSFHYD